MTTCPDPDRSRTLTIAFFVVLAHVGLNLVTRFVVAPLIPQPSNAVVLGGFLNIGAGALLSAAIYGSMIPTDFARGLAIWLVQAVLTAVIAVGLVVVFGGAGALTSMFHGGSPAVSEPAEGTGDFLLIALNELRELGRDAPPRPADSAPPGVDQGPVPTPAMPPAGPGIVPGVDPAMAPFGGFGGPPPGFSGPPPGFATPPPGFGAPPPGFGPTGPGSVPDAGSSPGR